MIANSATSVTTSGASSGRSGSSAPAATGAGGSFSSLVEAISAPPSATKAAAQAPAPSGQTSTPTEDAAASAVQVGAVQDAAAPGAGVGQAAGTPPAAGTPADDAATPPQKVAKRTPVDQTAAVPPVPAAAAPPPPAVVATPATTPPAAEATTTAASTVDAEPTAGLTATASPQTPAGLAAASAASAEVSTASAFTPGTTAAVSQAAQPSPLGASPVNVRVTATATGPSAWRADLAAASSAEAQVAASDAPTSNDDASASPSLAALLSDGAPVAAQLGGAAPKSADQGVGALNALNVAPGLGGATADTALVVGAAGGSSNAGSEDHDQDGAAKTARDLASAGKAASAETPLPDSVLEAAFGGLLAATTPLSLTSDDAPPSDTAVTSDTILDLAGQTAAQAPTSGVKSFQIVLSPEGLGQVKVSVSIGADGKLSAAFAFEKPEAATALGARAKELQEALGQSGFDVSTTGLSFSTASAQTTAATPALSQALTLNLGQDFNQGSSLGQTALSQSGDGGRSAASQTLGLTSLSSYGRLAVARGLDVRV